MPIPTPDQPVILSTPGEYQLASGQTYGRIVSRPTVPCVVRKTLPGPRPIITDPVQLLDLNEGQGRMLFEGLHFRGEDMNRMIGAVAMNGIQDLIFEDCIFEGCAAGLSATRQDGTVAAPSRVTVSKSIFRGCGAVGAFFNSIQGLLVEFCIFDENGWGDQTITGRPPDQSHGSYYIGVANSVTRNCLFVRNRMNAMRGCGQVVEDCLFIDNACAVAAGPDAMRIRNNVILWSHDHDPANGGRWGVGIDLNGGFNTQVTGNLIAHNRGTANVAGISAHGRYSGLNFSHNTIVGWDVAPQNGTAFNLGEQGSGVNWRTHNISCPLRGGVEVHGQGQDLWNHVSNRLLVPEQLVDAHADPVKWAESIGKPGLTDAQAIQAVVDEVEADHHAVSVINGWFRQQFRVRT